MSTEPITQFTLNEIITMDAETYSEHLNSMKKEDMLNMVERIKTFIELKFIQFDQQDLKATFERLSVDALESLKERHNFNTAAILRELGSEAANRALRGSRNALINNPTKPIKKSVILELLLRNSALNSKLGVDFNDIAELKTLLLEMLIFSPEDPDFQSQSECYSVLCETLKKAEEEKTATL